MRRIWVFILFIAFGCQQSTVNSQQTSCREDTRPCVSTENLRTVESESILTKGKSLKSKGKEKAHGSQLIAHGSQQKNKTS